MLMQGNAQARLDAMQQVEQEQAELHEDVKNFDIEKEMSSAAANLKGKEEHSAWERFKRTLQEGGKRKTTTEKIPVAVNLELAANPRLKDSYYNKWLACGESWGEVQRYELKKKISQNSDVTVEAWVTIDQLCGVVKSKVVGMAMAKKLVKKKTHWRPHPLVPENLRALQVKAPIKWESIKRLTEHLEEGFKFMGNMDHQAAAIAMPAGSFSLDGPEGAAAEGTPAAPAAPQPKSYTEEEVMKKAKELAKTFAEDQKKQAEQDRLAQKERERRKRRKIGKGSKKKKQIGRRRSTSRHRLARPRLGPQILVAGWPTSRRFLPRWRRQWSLRWFKPLRARSDSTPAPSSASQGPGEGGCRECRGGEVSESLRCGWQGAPAVDHLHCHAFT